MRSLKIYFVGLIFIFLFLDSIALHFKQNLIYIKKIKTNLWIEYIVISILDD